jgi:hypothetical protein
MILAVHLPASPLGRRSLKNGRAFPLSESDQPRRDACFSLAEKSAALLRIVDYLDVEHSPRYEPANKQTFCNIYATDYCYLAGAYLPRVWWDAASIAMMSLAIAAPVKYGETILEVNANALHKWLTEFGAEFGWIRATNLGAVQTAANTGSVCVITGQRTDARKSGHITCVIPESPQCAAAYSGSEMIACVQSQAGVVNSARAAGKAWWTGEQFRDHGFWVHV